MFLQTQKKCLFLLHFLYCIILIPGWKEINVLSCLFLFFIIKITQSHAFKASQHKYEQTTEQENTIAANMHLSFSLNLGIFHVIIS